MLIGKGTNQGFSRVKIRFTSAWLLATIRCLDGPVSLAPDPSCKSSTTRCVLVLKYVLNTGIPGLSKHPQFFCQNFSCFCVEMLLHHGQQRALPCQWALYNDDIACHYCRYAHHMPYLCIERTSLPTFLLYPPKCVKTYDSDCMSFEGTLSWTPARFHASHLLRALRIKD